MSMAPGWYPDPFSNGYVRWWDGERWTPQTALAQQQPEPGAVAQPGFGQPGSTQPGYGQPGYGQPGYPPAPPWGSYAGPVAGPPVATFPLASYGSRVGARLVDTLVLGVVLLPFAIAVLWTPLHDFINSLPKDGTAPSTQAVADFETRIVGRALFVSFASLV